MNNEQDRTHESHAHAEAQAKKKLNVNLIILMGCSASNEAKNDSNP